MPEKLYELDERKQRVLKAVIDDYIESAEPVGSRALARKRRIWKCLGICSICTLPPGGCHLPRAIGSMWTALFRPSP